MLTRIGLVLVSLVALSASGWLVFNSLAEGGESPAKTVQDALDVEAAKPSFTGQLGDFVVYLPLGGEVPTEADIFRCADGRGATNVRVDDTLRKHELWSDAFADGGNGWSCEGRGVILVNNSDENTSSGRGDGSSLARGYIRSLPVPLVREAPQDRLELITVEGHPGLLEHEVKGYPYPHVSLAVVERPPDGDRPGIVVFVQFAPSVEAAIRHAEELMP